MHSLFKGIFVLGLAMLVSCTPTAPQCQSKSVEEAKKSERALANFAINLLKNISEHEQEDRNEAISPISIALALSLLENGAEGETREQIKRLLLQHETSEEVLKTYSALQKQLQVDEEKVRVKLANGIFHDKSIRLNQRYTETSKQCLEAEVDSVDYQQKLEETRQKINEWVSRKTSDKIPELIKRGILDQDTKVILASALHLKASWERGFNERQTKKAPFYRKGREDDKQEVNMMKAEGTYRHVSDEKLQALELKYDQSELAMYVLLPKRKDGLKELERRLNGDELRRIVNRMETRKVEVQLPKFAVRSSLNLKKILSKMGLEKAFREDADFSRMTDEKIKIADAVHEAYVKVDEKGTEAAAATAIAGVAMTVSESVEFKADHPFIYTVIDKRTGAVVFIGKVNEVREYDDE